MADEKSLNLPQSEEKILEFWKKNKIFEKSLEIRKSGKRPFVFYEGPPYANGKPGIHHVLARVYKDIILRYKSMQGHYVPRKAGWDTHGLPVEIAAEKALGLKSKKDIEKFGIEKFNEEAQKAVWIYKDEWENLTRRIGYWLDLKNAYITCSSDYIETLWWVLAKIWKRGLLYKAHKVVPWCSRCGTALSSHELAQGYREVPDTSVYVKFKLKEKQESGIKNQALFKNAYILSWTTTPWTLPGNVALAVGKGIEYWVLESTSSHHKQEINKKISIKPGGLNKEVIQTDIEREENTFISPGLYFLAKDQVLNLKNGILKALNAGDYEKIRDDVVLGKSINPANLKSFRKVILGKDLVGLKYEQLFDIPALRNVKSHKIYSADFVTTEDGTGVVHTAVMYGEDDYELGKKVGLPQHHTVGEDGKFTKEVKALAGMFVKSKETEEKIFNYLESKNYLLKTEPYKHEYPFCWRCGSAVLYYARTSWFITMSKLRKELVKSNSKINWVPAHVKEGRFGEWIKEAKDWNLSRERYWGTPMPVWECAKCGKTEVVGSLEELKEKAVQKNQFLFLRHGEANNNVDGITGPHKDTKKYTSRLTEKGKAEVKKVAGVLAKKKIDLIVSSPLARAEETAAIVRSATGAKVIYSSETVDINPGIFLYKSVGDHDAYFKNRNKFVTPAPEGESWNDAKRRMVKVFSEINDKYKNKIILFVGHGDPMWLLKGALEGLSDEKILKTPYPRNGELYEIDTRTLPLDKNSNLDLHRPYVDAIRFKCAKCGSEMERIKEVADVWFDSGAMPYAGEHFPFAQIANGKELMAKSKGDSLLAISHVPYPADYICEAVDQTRGWFYTLLSVATALGYEAPYKNVICLGLINDKFGQKMSKSKGNIVDPWKVMNDYGVDAVRWYFYTATPPGEPKNFDENEVAKAYRKYHLIFWNSLVFYKTYAKQTASHKLPTAKNVLDKWILARLNETIEEATKNLEKYQVREAASALENFLDDLSRWYIRRSRRRFSSVFKAGSTAKDEKDYIAASQTLGFALGELAKLTAPFTPFFGEAVHEELGVGAESVHLEDWPAAAALKKADKELISEMAEIRRISSLALAKRAEIGIKVRQPLASLKAKGAKPKNKELIEILKDEVNVKKVVFDAKAKNDIEFDAKITPALKEEGLVRDLVRTIQELRQKAGLKPGENIELFADLPAELKSAVSKNEKLLKTEVGAKKIDYKKMDKFDAETETKLDGVNIWVGIKK